MKVITAALVVSHVLLAAQESDTLQQMRYEWGIVAGAHRNVHAASFSRLGSYPSCCPEFTGGSGWGTYAGSFFTVQMSAQWRLQTRLAYSNERGTLADDEFSFVADLRDSAQVVQALFQHRLDATLASIGVEPLIAFRPIGALDVMVGPRIAFVTSSMFHQTETLIEPADYGEYLGSGREWVNTVGDIPNASSLRLAVSLGLRYVLPVGPGSAFNVAPEIFYSYPLTNVTPDIQWSVSQFRFSVALFYSTPLRTPVTPPIVEPPLTPPPALTVPDVALSARFVRHANKDYYAGSIDLDTVVVEDTAVIDQMPLLGHIYFDHGIYHVPDRYVNSARRVYDSPESATSADALTALLGIVARRLKEDTSATITLTGSTADVDGDRGVELGRMRAEAVRDVLVSIGADRARIAVTSRRSPSVPTRASTEADEPYAQQENRRVEISSSSSEILHPITIRSTRRTITPDTAAVILTASVPEGLARRTVTVRSKAHSESHDLEFDSLTVQYADTVRLPSERLYQMHQDASDNKIIVDYEVELTSGKRQHAADTILFAEVSAERKQSEQIADVQIERYILILFRFDDASLTREHRDVLASIRTRIEQGNAVKIFGMTDAMGASDYNMELSRRRAAEVAKALGIKNYTIAAVGEEAPQFDNSLPEGRAYNRTVIIEVISPIR
ncbi:MAG: OmpA family protein [Ignavibacteria bacterium]|nr:OmpA family protein [Ignavibacteria bacterium]